MVNLRGPLLGRAKDLIGRRNRRLDIEEDKIFYKERAPQAMALLNRVTPRTLKEKEKVCMKELMAMIVCLEKFDQSQPMCEGEIAGFQKCYSEFRATDDQALQQPSNKTIPITTDPSKMQGVELNQYMLKFPLSQRTKKDYDGRRSPYRKN